MRKSARSCCNTMRDQCDGKAGREDRKKHKKKKMKPKDPMNLWYKLYLKPDTSFHLCGPIYSILRWIFCNMQQKHHHLRRNKNRSFQW